MPRSTSIHTLEEIEQEIKRLQESPHTKLYHKYMRLMNKRRTYMNQLRYEERKGKELAESGLTMENIEDRLSEDELKLLEEMEP